MSTTSQSTTQRLLVADLADLPIRVALSLIRLREQALVPLVLSGQVRAEALQHTRVLRAQLEAEASDISDDDAIASLLAFVAELQHRPRAAGLAPSQGARP